jgi:dTDP-L-rhamnose 4-epimerase
MKVLVTGGAGFIGSHLCERLHTDGHEVYVIDNLLPQVHGQDPKNTSETYLKVEQLSTCIIGDVCSRQTWIPLIGVELDAVVCLAAETGTAQSMFQAHSYCVTNITSIALLNDLIVSGQIRTKRVVLASSRSVYGDADLDAHGLPIATKETDRVNPKSIYAITKLCQENLLFTGFKDIEVNVLRFQNVYGPGQSLNNPYTGILSIFSVAINNNKDIQVFSDGMMSRDFVYISDVVDSIMLMLSGKADDREIYNVGFGERTTVLHVAKTLVEAYKSNVAIVLTGETLSGDVRHNFADISKIKQLGYQPKVSFDQGVKQLVDWIQQKGELSYNGYETSIATLRSTNTLS